MRTAFIGIGWWGCVLADAARRTGMIEVVLGCGLEQDTRAAFARRYRCPTTADIGVALANGIVEAVVLATPHLLHRQQAVAASQAGKHVFVEKPLATTHDDAMAIIAEARAAGTVLAVGHNRRLLPQLRMLADVIASGALGQLLHVEANFSTAEGMGFGPDHWRSSRAECPGGAMTVLGVHVIDWLHQLFGPIASVSAVFAHRGTPADMDDVASARLNFGGGLSATLVCLYGAQYTNRFVIHGTRATASVVATAPESEFARPVLTIAHGAGQIDTLDVPFVDTVVLQLRMFADAICGQGQPAVSGEEAGFNVSVLDALRRSAMAGGNKVEVQYLSARSREVDRDQ